MTGSRPTSDSTGPSSSIPRQFSGPGHPNQPRPQQPGYQQSMSTGDQWAVSPQDKVQFDQIYATVDSQNRGFITGEQAVGFFSNSRLPEEALAQIWDLADINSEGQLNRDEFAVAMYLIRQQRSKRDGREVLPPSLPSNLVPPSMRRQPVAPQQPTAPVFDNAANITAPKSASEDLFGLDAFSSPPIQPNPTGDSNAYTSSPSRNQTSPPPQIQQQPSHFKPFVPSSSFGQTMLTPQGTGTTSAASPVQNRGMPPSQNQPNAMDDLLGDNDPEVSKRLTNETSEFANLSNHVSTLTNQMQEVKTKRGSTEQSLSQSQSQKREFESRLSQLRSAYEQEVKGVQALEERLIASRNETKKLESDIAMIQGTHQDLQNQHRQIAEALSLDQNENVNLKEKIRQMNAEISELKPQLEKMRSDARQQKGLVAIHKKQLATNETEREKIMGDMDGASKEHEEATLELEESKRSMEAVSKATQSPSTAAASMAVTSPAASTASMNPFLRRTSNAATERGVTSPFTPQSVTSPNHGAFDSFFGPIAPATRAPPPTSFRSETPFDSREIPQTPAAPIQSQGSSEGPGVPTPSATPPPSNFSDSPLASGEPPAPPQSRQITSSFLPLRPHLERSVSQNSSVRVMPPGSRVGDLSGYETPTNMESESSVPESPKQHFEEVAATTGGSQLLASSIQQTPNTSSEGLQPQHATVPDDLSQSSGLPSATRDVPGAFPGDETPLGTLEESQHNIDNSSSSPYSSSRVDPRVDSAPRSIAPAVIGSTDADPFGKVETPTSAKDDFDSAFAGFGNKGKAPEQSNGILPSHGFGDDGTAKGHGEFPPIREFGGDDESESDSDRGFDDNFTAHSANQAKESGPNEALQTQAPVAGEAGGLAPSRPPFNTMESNASQLPTPGAQSSPPTYDQTIGSLSEGATHRKESNQFPAEYSGLLPARDDPTSPPISPPESTAVPKSSLASSAGIDRGLNFFGGDTAEQAAGHATIGSSFSQDHSPMSPGASTNAPYAYTQNPPPVQPSQTYPPVTAKAAPKDDFDDEFGDLSEAKEASIQGDDDLNFSRRSDFDDFNPTFDSPAASRTTGQSTSSTFPHDSFADFEASPAAGGGPTSHPAAQQETPTHDWDAMFAGLDTPQQSNGIQPDLPPRELGFTPAKPSLNGTAMAATKAEPVVDTASDDPILKRLTGMGYPRDASLNALEKFDYNIDKVCVSPVAHSHIQSASKTRANQNPCDRRLNTSSRSRRDMGHT